MSAQSCACPATNMSYAHVATCPMRTSCDGGPPCGDCDVCIEWQEVYYASLQRKEGES